MNKKVAVKKEEIEPQNYSIYHYDLLFINKKTVAYITDKIVILDIETKTKIDLISSKSINLTFLVMSLNNNILVYSEWEYKLIFYNYQTKDSVINKIPIQYIFKGLILNSAEVILVGGNINFKNTYQVLKYNYKNNQVISMITHPPELEYNYYGSMIMMRRRGFQKISDKLMLLVLTSNTCIIDMENFQFLTIIYPRCSPIDIRTGRTYHVKAKISEKMKKNLKVLIPISKSPDWIKDFSFNKFAQEKAFNYLDGFFVNDHIFFGLTSTYYTVIDIKTQEILEQNKSCYHCTSKSTFSDNHFICGFHGEYNMYTVTYLEK